MGIAVTNGTASDGRALMCDANELSEGERTLLQVFRDAYWAEPRHPLSHHPSVLKSRWPSYVETAAAFSAAVEALKSCGCVEWIGQAYHLTERGRHAAGISPR
jgi:hypothetical protein